MTWRWPWLSSKPSPYPARSPDRASDSIRSCAAGWRGSRAGSHARAQRDRAVGVDREQAIPTAATGDLDPVDTGNKGLAWVCNRELRGDGSVRPAVERLRACSASKQQSAVDRLGGRACSDLRDDQRVSLRRAAETAAPLELELDASRHIDRGDRDERIAPAGGTSGHGNRQGKPRCVTPSRHEFSGLKRWPTREVGKVRQPHAVGVLVEEEARAARVHARE